jgi:hypothetical protein
MILAAPGLLAVRRMDLQQKTIDRQPEPAHLIAVMDEAVLYRRIGSAEVMHEQLLHLAEQGRRKHVGVQVIPASARPTRAMSARSRSPRWTTPTCC